MLAFAPVALSAQDKDKTAIPLDHFYVTPRTGSTFFRRVLRNFHFGAYTGYGNTFFKNQLSGVGIYQAPGGMPQLFTTSTATRYTNWVNNAGIDTSVPGNYVVASNPANLSFKGHALNIPLAATVHYEFNRYRIGGGYSYELMSIGSLHPTSLSNKIAAISPSSSTGFVRKYWGMLGVSFYRWNEYLLTGDLQAGSYKLKTNYNTAQVAPGFFFNFGITAERELSEYLKVFVRPAYEIKSYTLALPAGGPSIHYNINAFYVNVGFTYAIPELPRCFLKDCHAQVNHAHGNKEYRSNRHAIYKKQNPGYGENDPVLIKYKGKNKRKINPY